MKGPLMGHHFDSPTSIEDPRIDPTDFFVFSDPTRQSTVFILNVNPDAGRNAAAEFRSEALYEIKVDTNGDVVEDLSLRFQFGEPVNAQHSVRVLMERGDGARHGFTGTLLGEGTTGAVIPLQGGVTGRAWAGHAADPFFANFFGHGAFIGTLMNEGKFKPEVFSDPHLHEGKPANSFEARNVMSIVIELPNSVFGVDTINTWATVSLYGHAPQVQVSRMANPVIVFYFGGGADPEKLTWLRGHPTDDVSAFAVSAEAFVTKAAAAAGRTPDPAAYAHEVVQQLLPDVLRFRVGSYATYGFAGRNGRALADDAVDLQLTTITNSPITEGLKPSTRLRAEFPYVGEPHTEGHEQTLFAATH
jgi:Domain of unknown function (DUF4331)